MARIANTSIDIFPLNLGANPFGWTADRDASFAILDAFVDAGGNFIDTADIYSSWGEGNSGGESETIIGQWLAANPDKRDKVIVATKSGALDGVDGRGRDNTFKAVDASLERLGVDSLDIFYYHYDDESVAIDEQVQIANDLIEQGKIRHLALSNYSPERLREFLETAKGTPAQPVAIQPQYNLLHRKDFEQGYKPIADEYGVSIFPYFSLASGLLTGKYRTKDDLAGSAREGFAQAYLNDDTFKVVDAVVAVADKHGTEPTTVALAWLLAKGVTAPIASVSKPEQLDALLAAPTLTLDDADIADLDAATAAFAG